MILIGYSFIISYCAILIIIIQKKMDLQLGGQTQSKGPQKTRVKVAIRVRPFIQKQKNQDGCIQIKSDSQIIIGKLKSYKFDRVFKDDSPQISVYQQCIKQLVLNCFQGYNAAVLAYGQTGSGKTHTMGTATMNFTDHTSIGIIPRTIYEIFNEINERKAQAGIQIKASFIQIYNQQIIDLLADTHIKNPNPITIREEKDGSISIYGAIEEIVTNEEQMFKLLENGGKNRTTASTLMNDASSRSHAIFTIFIKQILYSQYSKTDLKVKDAEEGSISAKFFFVDLAGSQRAKKTGATGSALREGININLGLLQLGNVISALSTIQKNKQQFITFRNSKLTRILQDCLGGNSNTYMIACVSPAQSNYQQSLNTLKYASKAMNIKNTPIVNRDQKTLLRQKINDMQQQNRRLRLMLSEKGVRIEDLGQITGNIPVSSDQIKKYKDQAKILNKKLYDLTKQLQIKNHKLNEIEIQLLKTKRQKDILQLNFDQIIKQYPKLLQSEMVVNLKQKFEQNSHEKISVLEKYMKNVQFLQKKLAQNQGLYNQMQVEYNKLLDSSKKDQKILIKKNNLIHDLSKQNVKLKKQINQLIKIGQQDQNQLTTSKSSIPYNKQLDQSKQQQHGLHSNNAQDYEMAILQNTQLIDQDQIIQEQDEKMLKITKQAQKDIELTQKDIYERQLYLQKLYADQRQNEEKLINTMKNDYDKKIINLQREIRTLLKQKDEGGMVDKNKSSLKRQNLQNQLKQLRKKAKQQKMMEKMVQNQKQKINKMTQSIKQMKNQRQLLKKKYEDDKKLIKKYKEDRIRQIMRQRQKYSSKIKQMKKLQQKNFRNKQQNKKKDEEIKRIKKVNQALKKITKPHNFKHKIKPQGILFSAQNNLNLSSQNLNNSVEIYPQNHNYSYNSQQILRQQQQTLETILKQLSIQIDRQNRLSQLSKKITNLQLQLQIIINDQSTLRLRLQRLKLKQQQDLLQQSQILEKQSLLLNHNDLTQRVKTGEQSLHYHQMLYQDIMNQNSNLQYFDIETQILYNKAYDHVEVLKIFIKVTYQMVKNLLFENIMNNNERQRLISENLHLKAQVNDMRQQFINLNAEYCKLLSQTREEMILNRYDLQQQEVPMNNIRRGGQQRQKKQLQKKIQDLSKTNRQITNQLQKTRRKCQVVQQKYQNIKNLVSKDKNIGLQDPSLQKSHKMSINQKQLSNKAMMDELQGLIQLSDNKGVDKLKKVRSYTALEDYSLYDRQIIKEEKYNQVENYNKWECVAKLDAHNSGVLSIALHQNMLISTATKSIKIWDLQTKKMMSQITGLPGPVKLVIFDPVRRLFFTACQKTITIWDPVTLRNEATLKCHKDEVKAIHNYGDYLFTGGKGTTNGGSLLIWDLRKINPNHATQQKQKNQDIFTLTSRENILYYGTRNHSVRRMNITNYDILAPFQPPHLDSVTGLAIVKNKLISGSKDKHVKLWSLDHNINNSKHTLLLFNDYVNSLHSPNNHSMLYAGSKDGQVKICYTKNDKIEILTSILAHPQSVNSIVSFTQNPYCLLTASQDKTIKIWQPTKQTIQNIGRQNYF